MESRTKETLVEVEVEQTETKPLNQPKQAKPKTQSGGVKRRHPGTNNPRNNKQARYPDYNKPKEDVTPNTLGFMEALNPLRLIQIDLHGLDRIAGSTYDILVYRDQRVRNIEFTKDQFRHICNLMAFYRLYSNAQALGTYADFNIPGDYSVLSALKTVEMPTTIVDYIQCIGRIILDHQRFAPYVPTIAEFFEGPMNTFYVLDERGNRAVDDDGDLIPCTLENFMQQYVVDAYTIASIRALTISKGFTTVNFDELEGKPELSVSYHLTDFPDLVQPRCFASQSNAVGNRGAAYRFWNSEDERLFGDDNLVDHFYGLRFNDKQYIANLVKGVLKL